MAPQPETTRHLTTLTSSQSRLYRPLTTQSKEIRLITLRENADPGILRYDMHVVDIGKSPRYYALSYAWGAPLPRDRLKSIEIDATSFAIRPTLFFFLQSMAAHHPRKSMWIDTICINQSNTEERNYQVSLMGDIYQQAHEVYVWLGSADADTTYAIDHIRNQHTQTQFDATMFAMCVEKLLKFTYWTRRWVIQEFALARNLILVCGDDQIDWRELTDRVDLSVVKADVLASETLRSFKEIRSLTRQDLSLLDLMERFRSARCSVTHDRAYALRSIASDGMGLLPDYKESLGALFFRLLSMLPTERVLPRLYGYRWPHNAAARICDLMQIDSPILLDSLQDDKDDRLYVVLEFVGRVERAASRSIDSKSSTFTHQIFVDDIGEYLLSSCDLKPGHSIYSLQTSPHSPKGLYIAFNSDTNTGLGTSLITLEPTSNQMVYWSKKGLSVEHLSAVQNVIARGIIICGRNAIESHEGVADQSDLESSDPRIGRSDKYSVRGSQNKGRRILCHVSRRMMGLLWLLDIGKAGDLIYRDLLGSDEPTSFGLRCTCMNRQEVSLSPGTSTTLNTPELEILPAFWTTRTDDLWNAAQSDVWLEPTTEYTEDQSPLDSQQMPDRTDADSEYELLLDKFDRQDVFYKRGRSELSYAAGEGLIISVEQLLKVESFMSASDDDGRSALWWAAYCDRTDTCKLLLYSGKFHIDSTDTERQSPLYWASRNGNLEIVEELIRSEVRRDNYFPAANPLLAASANGHLQIVNLLIEHGLDIELVEDTYTLAPKTALNEASAAGHVDIVERLLDAGAKIDDKEDRSSAMWAASSGGHLEIVELLLERGAILNIEKQGYCPYLFAASSHGHLNTLQFLLERGAIFRSDESSTNELQEAAEKGHVHIVKFLLDYGLNIDKAEPSGTSLKLASSIGRVEVVKLLLERGADTSMVNSPSPHDADQNTAVYEASKYGHANVLQLLLQYGADVNSAGGQGNNAIRSASQRGHLDVVKQLLDYGVSYEGVLRQAVRHDHFEIAELLLKHGVDLPEVDNALEQASSLGRVSIARLLLDRFDGTDLATALIAATDANQIEMVELLLGYGASSNTTDAEYGSVLRIAEANDHVKIAQLLRQHGAELGDDPELARTISDVSSERSLAS